MFSYEYLTVKIKSEDVTVSFFFVEGAFMAVKWNER